MPGAAGDAFDLIGSWTPLTLVAVKMEAGAVAPEVRSENAANYARLRGLAKAKEEVVAGGEVFTLPTGARPLKAISQPVVQETEAGVPTVNMLKVATSGVVTVGAALPAKSSLALDGLTFSLT